MSNNMDKSSQVECGEESKKQGKAHWDDEAFDAFIKICVVQTIDENRSGGHFSKKGWKNVVRKFSELTQRIYSQKLTNGLDLRKNGNYGHHWLENRLVWDPVKKTNNASNEWDIDVTSDGAWAPSQGFVHNVENVLPRQTENSNEDGDYSLENGLEFNDGLDNIDDVETSPNIETFQQDKEPKRERDGKKPAIGEKVIKRLYYILESVAIRSSRNNDMLGCT
ncbi:hypothetical protein L3X38_003934 [Prunus dulcis]|uniref:Myb/SANT-like domain-containing protein n=1 Tax=Prunus dulcis TaxID=3755 RepID=A0AAD4ZMZ7_PRUDU|nr:hypothetical protein L3X38_003934 [Prunus dulcis]